MIAIDGKSSRCTFDGKDIYFKAPLYLGKNPKPGELDCFRFPSLAYAPQAPFLARLATVGQVTGEAYMDRHLKRAQEPYQTIVVYARLTSQQTTCDDQFSRGDRLDCRFDLLRIYP